MVLLAAKILAAMMAVMLAWLCLAEPLGINDLIKRIRRRFRRRRTL